jgi:hypothetical protein
MAVSIAIALGILATQTIGTAGASEDQDLKRMYEKALKDYEGKIKKSKKDFVYGKKVKEKMLRDRAQAMYKMKGYLLTEEQQAEVIDFLRSVHPEALVKINRLRAKGDADQKEEGPSQYDFELFRVWHEKVAGLHKLKSKDPDTYARKLRFMVLERQCDNLAKRYKKAAEDEKNGIRSALSEKVSELFDLREAGRQEEVKKMEKELEELREKLAERQRNKGLIVERRVSELLVGSDALKW